MFTSAQPDAPNALTFGEATRACTWLPIPSNHSGSLFYSFASYISAGKVLLPMELQPRSVIESIASEKATGGWISVPIWSDIIKCNQIGGDRRRGV